VTNVAENDRNFHFSGNAVTTVCFEVVRLTGVRFAFEDVRMKPRSLLLTLFLVLSYGRLAAQQNPDSKRVQNIQSDEMWKRVKECVFPTYPGLVFNAHIKGTVDIGLSISPEGDVANYRVLSGHPLLVQSAVEAVRQWKFQPNVVQGELTWSRVRALARFNADGTTAVDLAPGILADNFGDPGTPRSSASELPRPATAPPCKSLQPWTGAQAKEIEASDVGSGFYKNNYFGLTFHFPVEWQVADRATLDSLDAAMKERGQSQSGAMPPNVIVTTFPSYTLFYARTDGPLGSAGPSVRIWAEKEPFVSSADQYFSHAHFLTDKTADGTRGPEEIEIGGRKFYRGDRWGKVDGRSVYEVRVVTLARELILAIDLDADSAATAEQLLKSLAVISNQN